MVADATANCAPCEELMNPGIDILMRGSSATQFSENAIEDRQRTKLLSVAAELRTSNMSINILLPVVMKLAIEVADARRIAEQRVTLVI